MPWLAHGTSCYHIAAPKSGNRISQKYKIVAHRLSGTRELSGEHQGRGSRVGAVRAVRPAAYASTISALPITLLKVYKRGC